MSKSNKQSKTDASQLAGEISSALSLPSFSPEGASGSPLSNEQPSQNETQQIGSMVMPRLAWTAVWTHSANSVRLMLGGETVEVVANGRWEPPPPKVSHELPAPRMGESHQSYYLRVLILFRGQSHCPETTAWIATRRWVGESSEQLRDAIAQGCDLPGHYWKIVNPTPPL